jgi:starch synthase
MSKPRILFVSHEILPFSPESHIAQTCRQMPQAVHERGKETRIFMPRFGKINERRHQLHEVIRLSGMNLIVDDTDHPLIIKVASIPQIRLQVYFIDNEEYFHRKSFFHDDNEQLFEDNDMRMIFFTKGVLETVKKLGWAPDIIHCHGWFSSLMPLYVKKLYAQDPHFADSKIVVSAYDKEFEGTLSKDMHKKVAFDGFEGGDIEFLKKATHAQLMKNAMKFADGIILGDGMVADEVKKFAEELEVPVMHQNDETDYLSATDEFFDVVLANKPVMV